MKVSVEIPRLYWLYSKAPLALHDAVVTLELPFWLQRKPIFQKLQGGSLNFSLAGYENCCFRNFHYYEFIPLVLTLLFLYVFSRRSTFNSVIKKYSINSTSSYTWWYDRKHCTPAPNLTGIRWCAIRGNLGSFFGRPHWATMYERSFTNRSSTSFEATQMNMDCIQQIIVVSTAVVYSNFDIIDTIGQVYLLTHQVSRILFGKTNWSY